MPLQKWPLKLNNGAEYMVNWAGAADGILWISGLDIPFIEAVNLFSFSGNTSTIVAPGNIIHDGYTTLLHVSLESDGTIKIALRKE